MPRIPLFAIALLLLSLVPLSVSSPRDADAAVTTSITPTTGAGDLSTTITQNGNMYNITDGTRAGTNLFHSFGSFSVGSGDIANFFNDTGLPTSNILGRVTGGDISNILGTIQTTGFVGTNLFLMNPAGFLFGPNATVNVGGMMTFTTANYLRLANGMNSGYFYAEPTVPSLLTTAPVAAFGFLGPNAASIAIQGGTLEVPEGKTLSFIGGPRTFTTDTGVTVPAGVSMTGGSLSAPYGLIYMATVTSSGEVPVPALSGAPLGTLELQSADPTIIRIRGGEFVMDRALLTATNSSFTAQPLIDVNIQGAMVVRNASSISSQTFGDGYSTDIQITAQSLLMDGSSIMSATMGSGQGGAVSITVPDTASFTNNSTINTNSVSPNVDAGPVSISASHVILQNSSILAEFAGDATTVGNGGAVTLTGTDSIDLIGSTIATDTSVSNGSGGTVNITAPTMTFDGSTIFTIATGDGVTPLAGNGGAVTLTATMGPLSLTDSGIITAASGSGNGGAVTMKGTDVTLKTSGIFTDVDTGGLDVTVTPAAGQVRPGIVTITAENTVTLSDSSLISALATGTLFDGGSVTITGKTVSLSDGIIQTSTDNGFPPVLSPSSGGTIEILGKNVNLTRFSLNSNASGLLESDGRGGNISLRGTDNLPADSIRLIASEVNTAATTGGDGGGTVDFQTKALTISDNSFVVTSSFGQGSGGTIRVLGGENVTIESGSTMGTDVVIGEPGHIPRQGAAGNILLETQNLTIRGGGRITATAGQNSLGDAGNITVQGTNGSAQSVLIEDSGSGIFTNTEGTGAGGDITLHANSVTLQNGGTLSARTSGTAATAIGGTITVDATNTVTMNTASITASSTGVADAGSINITALNGITMQNSPITTLAGQGASGGNIKITTSPAATVWLQDTSLISASVADGRGGGGNISIDPQFVILQNSQILAQAAQGQGGAITITTNLFLPDANSIVNADSGSGLNGTVTIQSPNAPASGQIQPLGQSPLLATSLLDQRCAALAGGEFSSFTVAGRDSLPTEPGSWLTSPLAMLGTGMGEGLAGVVRGALVVHQIDQTNQINQTNPALLSLRQIGPAGFLTQTFAMDRSTGCTS